ncbi:unnamed protein product [Pylaiella littoralis]
MVSLDRLQIEGRRLRRRVVGKDDCRRLGAKCMGKMGGTPETGACRTPEDHKKEFEASDAGAGMNIDALVNDPMMEFSLGRDATEVIVLLRKLLVLRPKKYLMFFEFLLR